MKFVKEKSKKQKLKMKLFFFTVQHWLDNEHRGKYRTTLPVAARRKIGFLNFGFKRTLTIFCSIVFPVNQFQSS